MDLLNEPLLTVIGSVIAAVLTAAVAIIKTRKAATINIQKTVNAGFKILIEAMEKQVQEQDARNSKLQETLDICNDRCGRLLEMMHEAGINPPPETP